MPGKIGTGEVLNTGRQACREKLIRHIHRTAHCPKVDSKDRHEIKVAQQIATAAMHLLKNLFFKDYMKYIQAEKKHFDSM